MSTWKIRVSVPYSARSHPDDTYPFTYSPEGCFRGGYSYRLGEEENNLYLIHADGELFLGSNWANYIIRGFSVEQISLCEEDPKDTIPKKYDCINGVCTSMQTYNTPGLYTSLADCQAVCANGGACASGKQCVDPTTFCPDGKVCIDRGEFASIEALISKIGSEVC